MSCQKPTGWKWDTVVYDRPGWNAFTYGWMGIKKRGDEIVLRFDSADASAINDDFYFEHYRQVALSSRDGCRTWNEIEPDWDYFHPLVLSDGTLVEVVDPKMMIPREEQKARLESLGIGRVWHDDCLLGWDLWPEAMTSELRARGLTVWSQQVREGSWWRYLPDGIVATYSTSNLKIRRSTDGGATWNVDDLPTPGSFSHFVCCFQGSVVLPDDTILVPCYGTREASVVSSPDTAADDQLSDSAIIVLRSADRGRTFEFVEAPCSASIGRRLNETVLMYHPSGRAVGLIRSDTEHCNIYKTISDDGGLSWSVPDRSGMRGMPVNRLCLKSGNLLGIYARRWHPAGIRAALSYDRGDTWDIAHEKIIRDDALPACFLGGPGVIQLDDETIFTFYSLPKLETPKEGDVVDQEKFILDRNFHQYIAGSRFTEDFVAPLGR